MYSLQTRVYVEKGKPITIDSEDLDEGMYIASLLKENPKTVEECRAYYFAMRDILADHIGYSKKEMHQLVKQHLIKEQTTKALTTDLEWFDFLKNFKNWAFNEFNCYL